MCCRWYEQAGTPTLTVEPKYDEAAQTLTLDVKQALPPTPGQQTKQPVLIPLAVALLGPDGKELPLRLQVGKVLEAIAAGWDLHLFSGLAVLSCNLCDGPVCPLLQFVCSCIAAAYMSCSLRC